MELFAELGTSLFKICVRACLENDVVEDFVDDLVLQVSLDDEGVASKSVTFSL